jgi:hypothetical protein
MSETRTPTFSEWADNIRATLGRLLCGNPDASFAAIIEAAEDRAAPNSGSQTDTNRRFEAPLAVSREASVPQGGEFTAAEVEAQADHYYRWATTGNIDGVQRTIDMLRAYARALTSAPGERT